MLTEVTSGVRISVIPRFEPGISNPLLDSYVFSYKIIIENQNDYPVQLLRRHWYIFDSVAIKREVEGPGVVGEMPIINPGEYYTYESACDLRSLRGTMQGFYNMQRPGEAETFHVRIPKFKLEVPYGMN
ncbi:MAG: Co2+/Mg2+ efflux protein ApaG [Flavobacteriales bacterium]|jgi:ApaG protein